MSNIGLKRIALSGSASVGKTTFANDFSIKYEYPIIIEGVREWLRDNNIDNFLEMSDEDKYRMQHEILESKIKTEKSLDFFIADRSTIDNAIYMLNNKIITDIELDEYIYKCVDHARNTYDVIIFFPPNLIPFEDDGVRYPNYPYQLKISYMIRGLLTSSGIPTIFIESSDRTERIIEVSEKLVNM